MSPNPQPNNLPVDLHWPTAEEEAAIQRGISQDPDNPEWTEDDFAHAVPAATIMPAGFMAEHQTAMQRRRGPQKAPTKALVSLRLDRDVIERLRAGGRGWQTRANQMLRKALENS